MLFTERVAMTDDAVDAALRTALSSPAGVRASYQPIVRLCTGEVVGHEALARWPESPQITPTEMFAAAHRLGWENRLDDVCRRAAITGIPETDIDDLPTLFVNVEVCSITLVDLTAMALLADERCRIILEFTERSLLHNPGRLLEITEHAQALGFGIALDDVGSNAESMTMLEFVAPDIIKLDRSLLHARGSAEHASIVAAVIAHAESTGALILVEGIETPEERARATTFGATLGQGWLFGRPGPLPPHPPGSAPLPGIPLERPDRAIPAKPSDLLTTPTDAADETTIAELIRNLEEHARHLPEQLTILATTGGSQPTIEPVVRRFRLLARDNAFVALVSPELPTAPASGVRGGLVPPDDPFADDWAIAILGHSYCATLIARDATCPSHGDHRRFAYQLSFDRAVTVRVARSIMRRVGPVIAESAAPVGRSMPPAPIRTPASDAAAATTAKRVTTTRVTADPPNERSARAAMVALLSIETLFLAVLLVVGRNSYPALAGPLGIALLPSAIILLCMAARGRISQRTLLATTVVTVPAATWGTLMVGSPIAIPLMMTIAGTVTMAVAVGGSRRVVATTGLGALAGISIVVCATTLAPTPFAALGAGVAAITVPAIAVDRLRISARD